MGNRKQHIQVKETSINVRSIDGEDYICLTDMVKNIGGSTLIEKWFRNKNTLEFLGVWEALNNPDFKTPEFEGIKNQAGSNRFLLSAKQWIDTTNAIGVRAQPGRYGGTYAHKDIAFEFGSWVSPEFKLILIKEFQRLKKLESEYEQWDYHRFLTKVNYRLQTSAVKEIRLPLADLPKGKEGIVYAEEAELVNLALFGHTSKDWRKANPKLARKNQNVRDTATVVQLTVLANLESMNSMLIAQGQDLQTRFNMLGAEASRQLNALAKINSGILPGPSTTPLKLRA